MIRKKKTKPQTLKRERNGFFGRNIFLILAFFIPFLLMFVCFALFKVSPFGNNQILVTDLWHQYYPFLVDFQDKLQSGGSLLWTWKSGCGTNYISLMSYYLASPLNFLSVFVPADYLREFLYVAVCTKIGCAGLFFSIFLKITYKRNDASLTIFPILYALCSFIMGYYWNVIWLDTVALLPLVVAGTIALLKHGKFKLYIITIALSILANYYIGLFTCIFILLVSIGYSIVEFKGVKNLFGNFFKMLGCSAVGIGMSAILTLPAYFALGHTYSSVNKFPDVYSINISAAPTFSGTLEAIRKIIANSVAFIEPTAKEGLPNIYCGILAIILGILYLTCKKIKIREKIFSVVLLAFFIMSFIIRQLDYIWHGFHFPNMLPYRFSFLFSFVLIFMAFRAFMYIDGVKLLHVFIAAGGFLGVLAISYAFDDNTTIIASTFIGFLIIVWLMLYSLRVVPKGALSAALCIIVFAECACTAYIGVRTVTVTDGSYYPLGTTDTQSVIDYMDEAEENNIDLYRAECTKYYTLNDNALCGYNGISMFNSMANANVTQYMERFGICGWAASNRYTYQESSPVTNLFLNLKYLVSTSGLYLNKDYFSLVAQSGGVKLLKNKAYLPQGFMVGSEMLDYEVKTASSNPLDNQNRLFNLATGLDGNVYEYLEVVSQGHTDYESFPVTKTSYGSYTYSQKDTSQSPHLKFNYEAPYDGLAYAYFACGNTDNTNLMVNDNSVVTYYTKRPFIMEIGNVKKGDKISVFADLTDVSTGSCNVYCAMLNKTLFEQGYEKLSQSTLKATKVTDSKIEGTISVKQDGLFYTSMANDDGWSAYVDGEKTEITPVGDALVAFKLSAGEHEIELSYMPEGFALGLFISLGALIIFILMILAFGTKDRQFVIWLKKLFDKYREIVMYLFFGVLTTVVSWVTYALFTKLIPDFSLFGIDNTSVIVSNVLSWICAVAFAYITNKIWVFSSKSFKPSVIGKEMLLFISSRLATGVVEWVGVPLLLYVGLDQRILGIEGMLSKIIVSIIVVILNYVLSKLIVFKKQKTQTNEGAELCEELPKEALAESDKETAVDAKDVKEEIETDSVEESSAQIFKTENDE